MESLELFGARGAAGVHRPRRDSQQRKGDASRRPSRPPWRASPPPTTRRLATTSYAFPADPARVPPLGRRTRTALRPGRSGFYAGPLFDRLADLETELEKLESQLSELYASGDQQAAAAAGRRTSSCNPIVEAYRHTEKPRPTSPRRARCWRARPTPRCASTSRRDRGQGSPPRRARRAPARPARAPRSRRRQERHRRDPRRGGW